MSAAAADIFFDTECSIVIMVRHCIDTIFVQWSFSCSISLILQRVQVCYIANNIVFNCTRMQATTRQAGHWQLI